MDPLSVTASVAGLIGLVGGISKLIKEYFLGVKNASDKATAFLLQLDFLSSNLLRLHDFLEKDHTNAGAFSQKSLIMTCITDCGGKIKHLTCRFDALASKKWKQAVWPFAETEYQKKLQGLKDVSHSIHFALSMNTAAMLTKTSEEISEMLAVQLQSLQQLRAVDSRTLSIEDAVTAQAEAFRKSQKEEEKQKVLSWLSNYDPQAKHAEVSALPVADTGEWLFDEEAFRAWRGGSARESLLWLSGAQGVGKSTLASLVIDTLENDICHDAVLAYFYFDKQTRKTLTPAIVIGSLTRQILSKQSDLPLSILDVFKKNSAKERPKLSVIETAFKTVCAELSDVYIILDGLDEYAWLDSSGLSVNQGPIPKFLDLIRKTVGIHWLMTSRDSSLAGEGQQTIPEIDLKAHDTDIKQFLSTRLAENPFAGLSDGNICDKIADSIAKSAQNSFLLSALHLNAVLGAATIGDMEDLAQSLPATVEDAFGKTISDINCLPEYQKQAGMATLKWLFYSHGNGRLRLNDLKMALSIRVGLRWTEGRYRPPAEMIIRCTRGLVSMNKVTSHLRLMHTAVLDYLESHETELFPSGYDDVAEVCLEYLSTPDIGVEIYNTERELQKALTSKDFLWYAVCNWGFHVQKSQNERFIDRTVDLLRSGEKRSGIVQNYRFMQGFRSIYWSPEEAYSHTALHAAALFGLPKVARRTPDSKHIMIDASTSIGTTALMMATACGDLETMKVLLSRGADPTIANWYGTSLHAAAEAGQCQAIELLLENKIDINIKDPHGRTSLVCAAQCGKLDAVEVLLKLGASPCFNACGKRVQFFINNSTEIHLGFRSLRDKRTESALWLAIRSQDIEFVRILLVHGVHIPEFALHSVAYIGNTEIAQMLIETGVSVNTTHEGNRDKELDEAQDEEHRTPYWYALAGQHTDMQELLARYGSCIYSGPTSDERE